MNDEIRSISRPRQCRAELGTTSVFDHLVEFEGVMLLLLIHHDVVSSCIIIFLAGNSSFRLLCLLCFIHATIIISWVLFACLLFGLVGSCILILFVNCDTPITSYKRITIDATLTHVVFVSKTVTRPFVNNLLIINLKKFETFSLCSLLT